MKCQFFNIFSDFAKNIDFLVNRRSENVSNCICGYKQNTKQKWACELDATSLGSSSLWNLESSLFMNFMKIKYLKPRVIKNLWKQSFASFHKLSGLIEKFQNDPKFKTFVWDDFASFVVLTCQNWGTWAILKPYKSFIMINGLFKLNVSGGDIEKFLTLKCISKSKSFLCPLPKHWVWINRLS